MDYREFTDRVSAELKNVLPEEHKNAEISARQVDKLQGASYYGISVQPENSSLGVSLNLAQAYEKLGGCSFEQILAEIGTSVTEAFANRPQLRASELLDYSVMKEKLMLQVVPTAGNEELLSGVPHVNCEDMSLVYRFVLGSTRDGVSTALVTNEMLASYGISSDRLHEDALKTAPLHFPPSVRTMREVIAEMMGLDPETLPDNPGSMYIATCNSGINGAGCIFYPEFMDNAAELLGGNFFILPSSIHEVILLPDNGEYSSRDLQGMVRQINMEEVSPEDRLSDNVYHYDAKDRVFEMAESFDARMAERDKEHRNAPGKSSVMEKLAEKKKEAQALAAEKHSPARAMEQSL